MGTLHITHTADHRFESIPGLTLPQAEEHLPRAEAMANLAIFDDGEFDLIVHHHTLPCMRYVLTVNDEPLVLFALGDAHARVLAERRLDALDPQQLTATLTDEEGQLVAQF